MSLSVIILAAGKGTRMKSSLPKVLHKIANREMLNLAIDTAKELNPDDVIVVISEEMEKFTAQISEQHPKTNLIFSIQKQQLGTANALQSGLDGLLQNDLSKTLTKNDSVLVLYGDTPLIKVKTLQQMLENLSSQQNQVCVLGFNCYEENKYGRLVIEKNQLTKIVEFKDATDQEKLITLCNSGVIAVDGFNVKNLLNKINNNNASKEYYLTDIVAIATKENLSCGFIQTNEDEVMGINSRVELAKADKIKQKEIRKNLMENGVTLINPKSIYFSFDTKIANDVVIHPNVVFGVGVEVASDVEIKSFCHIEGAKIFSKAVVGPFARIRPETIIEEEARVGNFVEIKKSTIKKGSKINHLSYIGDAQIGEESNIGAGTITCNYDGYKKSTTIVGKKVFIGSNTALIAPVNIGDGAVIGAGSVIDKDVKSEDLAIARAKQENIENGGRNYRDKRK